jgi:hypothetical protein
MDVILDRRKAQRCCRLGVRKKFWTVKAKAGFVGDENEPQEAQKAQNSF